MSDVLDQLHDDLSRDLHRVKKRFKPGVKVTLVIRRPDNVEADVVIGDDDMNEAIATIQRRIAQDPHGAKPPCSNTSPRVCQDLQSEQHEVDRDRVARVVRATLKGIDHHINAAGEVYSPVPPPTTVYSGVRTPANIRQSGVHYKGQRRRRGYKR